MNIRAKITLSLVIMSLLSIFSIGSVSFFIAKKQLIESSMQHLETVARAQENNLNFYVTLWHERVHQIGNQRELRHILEETQASLSISNYEKKKRILEDATSLSPHIMSLSLCAADGNVILSTEEEIDYQQTVKYCRSFVNNKIRETSIEKFWLKDDVEAPRISIIDPIVLDDEFIGALFATVQITELNDIAKNYNGLGKTGETLFAIKDENVVKFLTPTRHRSQGISKMSIGPENEHLPVVRTLLNKEPMYGYFGLDYRGESIMTVTHYVPSLDLAIITKIDRDEVLLPINKLLQTYLLFFAGILLLIILAGSFLGHSIAKPILLLAKVAEKIRDGDFSQKADIRTKDETGRLALIFNDMMVALEQARVLVKERLDESENHYKALFDTTLDAIVTIDKKGFITHWNKHAEEIFGWSDHEVIGQKMADIIIPEEYREAHNKGIKRFLETGTAKIINKRLELKALNKQGDIFPLELTVTAIKIMDQYQFTAFMRDLTDKHEVEKALKNAKLKAETANHAKTEFLTNMSHEMRTPMTSIIGLTDILNRDKELSKKQLSMVKTLKTSGDTLMDLINDLLDLGKIESKKIELEMVPFSFNDIIEDVVSIHETNAASKGVSIKTTPTNTGQESFLGDPHRIKQIILNLVSNAIKFTNQGTVEITIKNTSQPDSPKQEISISVIDTGIGISKDKQIHIFDRFIQADGSITRKYGGTGLGLTICKELAEVMGGAVTLKSKEGKGSTFTLSLLLEKIDKIQKIKKKRESKKVSDKRTQSKSKPLALIVEDHEPNVLVAGTILESLGYDYDAASNGKEGLEILKKNHDLYDIVLMDIQMPEMDGLEVTRHIRSEESEKGWLHLPIIALTAHATENDERLCKEAGMDHYLTKPYNIEKLSSILGNFTNFKKHK